MNTMILTRDPEHACTSVRLHLLWSAITTTGEGDWLPSPTKTKVSWSYWVSACYTWIQRVLEMFQKTVGAHDFKKLKTCQLVLCFRFPPMTSFMIFTNTVSHQECGHLYFYQQLHFSDTNSGGRANFLDERIRVQKKKSRTNWHDEANLVKTAFHKDTYNPLDQDQKIQVPWRTMREPSIFFPI